MNISELKEKIIDAYRTEKYARLLLLLLFLQEDQDAFRPLVAKLVLESDRHKDLIENVLRKLDLGNYINEKHDIQNNPVRDMKRNLLMKTIVDNEILAMNNYLYLLLFTERDLITGYFDDPDEYYRTFEELTYEELTHAKKILEFIFKNMSLQNEESLNYTTNIS